MSLTGIKNIMMTSWSSFSCGGGGISVELENPDGTQCLTTAKDLSRGETLLWSEGRGLDSDCSSMVISEESTLYIQSSRVDDFCPQHVWITTEDGAMYASSNLTAWYDKEKTNSKKHALVRSESKQSNFKDKQTGDLWLLKYYLTFPVSYSCPLHGVYDGDPMCDFPVVVGGVVYEACLRIPGSPGLRPWCPPEGVRGRSYRVWVDCSDECESTGH